MDPPVKDPPPAPAPGPPPPPPTYGAPPVTMVTRQETRSPYPASYVKRYLRRHAATDEPAGGEPLAQRVWRAVRDFGRRHIVRDPAALAQPRYAAHTVNDFLAEGFTLADIRDGLDADSLDALRTIGLEPPLHPSLWAVLARDWGLDYPRLEADFGLINVRDYRAAGLTAPVLAHDLAVTFGLLLEDARLDATALDVWPARDWSSLGLAAHHSRRLGLSTDELAAALAVTRKDLVALGIADPEYPPADGQTGHPPPSLAPSHQFHS